MTMCGSRKDSIRQSRKVHYNVRLKQESNKAIKKKKTSITMYGSRKSPIRQSRNVQCTMFIRARRLVVNMGSSVLSRRPGRKVINVQCSC